MIPNFYHVIKNEIFTNMTIRLYMESPKFHYKLNNNNKNTLKPTFLSPLTPFSSPTTHPSSWRWGGDDLLDGRRHTAGEGRRKESVRKKEKESLFNL